ncbi:MAG: hypothetical protein D3904_04580 [Candidatus Electrothrix sp. EH2]|nr:hypothetical protein [Candidatus Electrothrix sp. EH2]
MAAKKPPFDRPAGSISESSLQNIAQEKNPLIEGIVEELLPKLPDHSEEEIRLAAHDTIMYVTQKVMEGNEVILGNSMLLRRKPDKDSPEAKGPRPGDEHLLHVDIEYTPSRIPGQSKDSFPMSLPPDLTTKH